MSTKKKIILGLLGVLLIGGVAFGYQAANDESETTPEQTVAEPNTPAADEGSFRNAGEDEEAGPTTSEEPTPTPSSKQNVTVSISDASYDGEMVNVRAFANVLEDGTCTLTFTKSGQKTLTYTGSTEMQPSYTQCNPFNIPHTEFPVHGTWKAKVVFESATSRGEASQDVTLE